MKRKPTYTQFHDKHNGETGIIIANGPSLRDVPIEFLMSVPSFGCNFVHRRADGFAPTYYANTGMNHLDTLEKRQAIYPAMDSPHCEAAFINRLVAHLFPFENIYGILSGRAYGLHNSRKFSLDPLHIIGIGGSMLFGLFQIAYYMGFDRLYVVGLDHDYSGDKHFYDESDVPYIEEVPGPHYQHDNKTWQAACDGVFTQCRIAFEMDNREIINMTPGSKCDVFKMEAPAW